MGQKHAKLAAILDDFKLDGEYLRSGWRCSQSDKYMIDRNSSCDRWNKSSELWPSSFGNLEVKSYPPKLTSSKGVFWPLGSAASPDFYVRQRMTKSC